MANRNAKEKGDTFFTNQKNKRFLFIRKDDNFLHPAYRSKLCFTVTSVTFTPRANESDNGEARDDTYQRCGSGSVTQAVGKEGKEELPFHPVNLLCVPDVAFDPVGD